MNTVSFYLQAWILLMLLAGPCAVLMWRALFWKEQAAVTVRRGGRWPRPSSPQPRPRSGSQREGDNAVGAAQRDARPAHRWRRGSGHAGRWLSTACATPGRRCWASWCWPARSTRSWRPDQAAALRAAAPTMDGMAFMAGATYMDRNRDLDLPSGWRAIRWVLDNVQGTRSSSRAPRRSTTGARARSTPGCRP